MKKHVSLFISFSLLLSSILCMSSLFAVFSIIEGMERWYPGTGIWLPAVLLCHVVLRLFLKKQRSVSSAILLCTGFFVAQMLAVFLVYGKFSSIFGILIAACMWMYSYFRCYELVLTPLTVEKTMQSFDLAVMALIFCAFYCNVNRITMVPVLPLVGAVLLDLASLVIKRTSSSRKGRGKGFVALFSMAAVFIMAALSVVLFASDFLNKLVTALFKAIVAAAEWISWLLNTVILFLLSLIPPAEYDMGEFDMEANVGLAGAEDITPIYIDPETVMTAAFILVLAAAAALVAYFVIKGRGRISLGRMGGEQGIARNRPHIGAAIKRALVRFAAALRFKTDSLIYRNSAPGLLLWLEKFSRPGLHGRGKDETVREFLIRAEKLYPEATPELRELADTMDALYFGRGEDIAHRRAAAIRQEIARCERKREKHERTDKSGIQAGLS